ncbi:unnamed protein product [Mesocestoides corti]|uniref:Dynein axonemal intermediate chain 1 n=1 Tax=Mesocestoides corti TaxID=53468 RepID=A0A0R3U354_MESCO|nr:unnamed protein product [Mesocestoides corti]
MKHYSDGRQHDGSRARVTKKSVAGLYISKQPKSHESTKLPQLSKTKRTVLQDKHETSNLGDKKAFQIHKQKQDAPAERRPNVSIVVEATEQSHAEILANEALKRKRVEQNLDQLIRSIKPTFCRDQSIKPPDQPNKEERNVSNTGTTEQQDSHNASSTIQRHSSFFSMRFDKPGDENDRNLVVEETDYRPPASPSGKEPVLRFNAETEFVDLPFSKDKIRVPPKKIIQLKHLPTDPLAKHRKEKRVFAVGFKLPVKTDSAETLEDSQQIHQAALMRLCEAYTKNLGPEYLRTLMKESVQSIDQSDDEDATPVEWKNGATFVEDATERIWNWDKSLINSKLLLDSQGRSIFTKDLVKGPFRDSPDIFQGSLGPNDCDIKSDLAALLCMDSDSSTDIEFDETDFVKGHTSDSIVRLNGQKPSKTHTRKPEMGNSGLPSTGSMVSAMDSALEVQQEENEKAGENAKPGDVPADASDEPQAAPPAPSGMEADAKMKTTLQAAANSAEPTSTSITSISLTATTSGERRVVRSASAVSGGSILRRRRKGTDTAAATTANKKKKPRFAKRQRQERRARDPIEVPIDVPVEKLQTGLENVAIDWCKIIMASNAPNPMRWFDAMGAMEHQEADAVSLNSEGQGRQREAYGLGKRFVCVAGGLEGLDMMLKHTAEPDQPKAEVLLDCMVKNYKLQMPLAVGDPVRLRELYENTILKNPILYKMVLRRRNILPDDLQAFVARIIETTESSDAVLAALYPSKSNTDLILNAAKEMFASGYLAGGPPCPKGKLDAPKKATKKKADSDEASEGSSEKSSSATEPSTQSSEQPGGPGESSRIESYGSDVNYEKAFGISLRNPSRDILQEVAYHIPEFAYYVRPLFETRWVKIATDKGIEELLPELCTLRNMRQRRLELMKVGFWFTEKEEKEEALKVRQLSRALVTRLCDLLRGPLAALSGSGVWMGLLACLHGIMFWPPIGDFLICKLKTWIPALLLTLYSEYPTVREDGCCVLSFLVCCYHMFSRLQKFCRYLLISNITFALLDAMERYRDTYACFHGTLGYLLHSVPCSAVVDCLLAWVPDIINQPSSALANDWPLFIYYIARHWPDFTMNWNLLYERQVLNLLERGLRQPASKHNARLAIGYFVRRKRLLSTVATCWREGKKDL